MNSKTTGNDQLSPIIFYYDELDGMEYLWPRLEDRFRQTGHTRPILFREYDCYKELPGTDGDLYTFDGIVLSALVDKGFLRSLPKAVSFERVFPWAMEKSKIRQRSYGVPFMLCANALICRQKDDPHVNNIMELNENVAIPLRSMLMFYFVQAVCENLSLKKSFRVMEHLLDLIGGKDFLEKSGTDDYDGVNRFNRGECRYLLSFMEYLYDLEKDDYMVSFVNFSDKEESRSPHFLTDFVSVGKHVPKEKLKDCLDLIDILISEEFIFELCIPDGELQYLLPADRCVFQRLAEIDPIYRRLYDRVNSEKNSVLRYGKHFYENFYSGRDILLHLLWERAGWRP